MRRKYLLMIGTFCLVIVVAIFGYLYFGESKEKRLLSKADFAADDYERIQPAIHQFGMEYIQSQYTDSNDNLVLSPASIFIVLSAVAGGAVNETEEVMHEMLHVSDLSKQELKEGNAALLDALYREMEDIDVSLANAIWLTDQYRFEEEFVKDAESYFTASIETADLTSQQTMQAINDWVATETNDKINKMLDEPLDDQTVALLLNALYFKGAWNDPFNENATDKEDFTLENGQVKQVPMMYKDDSFYYTETEVYQAIRIPYAKGEWSMYVYLPREEILLEDWLVDVQGGELDLIKEEMEIGDGELYLPKIKMTHELIWTEYLKENGMARAFDQEQAEFDAMLSELENVWLSEVQQKTFIEVNEEGTEAASVSTGEMKGEYALPPDGEPFVMKVDRPYFFTITDEKTNVDLFMGTIADPE